MLHRGEIAPLRPAPHLNRDLPTRLRDTYGLAERLHHVRGEEERVEAEDGVELVVGVGERLHLADADVGLRDPLAGDRHELP
jgi:hypothetical protein